MSEIFEKVVTKLKKLDNYYVLGVSKGVIFIGTTIIFKEHIEIASTFQTYTQNRRKELPIFFLISLNLKPKDIEKKFLQKKIPILFLSKKDLALKAGELEKIINGFVDSNF